MHSQADIADNRGGVTGNGGSMETKKRETKKRETKKQGAKKQEQQTGSTAKKRASRRPGKASPAEGDGVESFRSAAERELVQRGRQIAKALGKKAAGGDVSSTKLLMSEAGRAGSKTEKKKAGKGTAQELAKGPLWDGPPAKTGEEFENWNGDPDAGGGSGRPK